MVGPYDAPPSAPFVRDIPVVFALVAAPVRSKIAPSITSSGRNVTGAVHVVPTDVQMRAMQTYKPFSKVGVIYSPNETNSLVIVKEIQSFCDSIGASLITQPLNMAGDVPTGDGVEQFVRDLRTKGADWLYLPPDTFLATIFNRIAPVAIDVACRPSARPNSSFVTAMVLWGWSRVIIRWASSPLQKRSRSWSSIARRRTFPSKPSSGSRSSST